MTPKDTQRRRIACAAWRILDNRDEPQYRAIDRLTELTDFSVALEFWLQTKPDPALVEEFINFRLLQGAMRDIHIGRAWEAATDFKQSITTLQQQAGKAPHDIALLSEALAHLAKEATK